VFDMGDRRAAGSILTAADHLRESARGAPPGAWQVTDDMVVVSEEGDVVAVVAGVWAPSTARYLAVVAPNTAFLVAELMWRCQGMVSRGEMPGQIREALVELAREITPP
jgi:hypothetical protein